MFKIVVSSVSLISGSLLTGTSPAKNLVRDLNIPKEIKTHIVYARFFWDSSSSNGPMLSETYKNAESARLFLVDLSIVGSR